MKDKQEFFELLGEIDGRDFSEYGRIIGDYDFSRYILKLARIPTEADDSQTLIVVRVPSVTAGFPPDLYATAIRRTALEDLLVRKLSDSVSRVAAYDDQGISRRRLSVATPGQKILPRSALVISDDFIEARLIVQLPARRGTVLGEEARHVFFEELPAIVNSALIFCNLEEVEVNQFVDLMEDADAIRQALPTRGLIGFVGEGAFLIRVDHSDRPDYNRDVPFVVPDELLVDVEVPNKGRVRGLGIPSGITVILGDAYSGRRELMKALAAGIYNHVPGDGREYVVTTPDAVYIAAEDRRSVQRVDISAFVRQNPAGRDVRQFTTTHADPSAAQAASVAEALEVGARALLFDESDSNSGFLSQDSRLKGLAGGAEPRLVPFSVCARQMVEDLGISVVVAGASSVAEFIPVADTVLRVDDYQVVDVTREAKQLSIHPEEIKPDAAALARLTSYTRWIVPSSLDATSGRHDAVIGVEELGRLRFGNNVIDLTGVAQLADTNQIETIGLILYYAKNRYLNEGRPIREVLDLIDRDLSTEGLECLTRDLRGDLARPRRYEIAAALNRLASLRISRAAD
ncbi:MAG: ABC-ATPase domain-containing protein [Kiritimatiellae bacterium]|nr:ABC-ATPase domain-containing protein [Kiritimatiellia bacterium]